MQYHAYIKINVIFMSFYLKLLYRKRKKYLPNIIIFKNLIAATCLRLLYISFELFVQSVLENY